MKNPKRLAKPIVQGTVVFKFQCADRMRDAFDRIGLTVSPVVHWVDAPVVSGPMVVSEHDPIKDWISQVEVGRFHVDFCSKRSGALCKLAVLHAKEQVQIFLDGAVSKRTISARLGQGASVLAHLIGVEVAHVGMAFANQLQSPIVELLEVVRSVEEIVPIKAEPTHVALDRVDVLLALFARVGVVEPQVALATVGSCEPKIQADAFGMSDVQIAIGLRRKTGLNLPAL